MAVLGVVTRASSDTLASDDEAVVAMLKALRASAWRKTRIATVAARTGFPSLQYMTTFFRRHTGTTPARLRAMERPRERI